MPHDDLHAALRLAVHGLRSTQRLRVFPPVLNVGELEGEHLRMVLDPELRSRDAGMRTDLAVAMLAAALPWSDHPAVWLTRTGTPHPQDLDLEWVPAIRRGCEILGIEPRCVVVLTKSGWFDPVGGDRAQWSRLRIRAQEVARSKAAGDPGAGPEGSPQPRRSDDRAAPSGSDT